MRSLKKQKYTLEEYIELDHNSEEKIEYWNGNIFTFGDNFYLSSLECEITLTEILQSRRISRTVETV